MTCGFCVRFRGVFAATLLTALAAFPLASPAAADQAREAVGLFVQSCLRYVEDSGDLRAWIDETPQLRKFAPRQAQAFLDGRRGDVWSAANDSGLFALVLFNDDTCTVMAQQASADQVSLVFSEYVRRKNLPLDKVGDRREFVRSIDQREETYRSSDGRILYEVVLITSKSPRAEVQAVLTTRPNR
ncbi:NMCC_0638 family (lipo)protein [Pelagibius sp.]|uniref:NMCC_0638 family (lipo)protein n=1 Tax=Pelagibius sp. TaxID=1931238 RepID=UPI003B50C7EC